MLVNEQTTRSQTVGSDWMRLALLAAVTLLGCNTDEFGMVPVSGTITFDGGQPPAHGRISFAPSETFGDLPNRPGMARFGADGKFTVTSFKPGDGLIPGRYRVTISCLSGLPDISQRDASASISYIAPDYEPDELVIEPGSGPRVVNYDVPLKK